jgi:hypothetical protein
MSSDRSGQGNAASEALRTVGVPDAFLFFVSAERYTGEFATSLAGLFEKLGRVPLESVEFHFHRTDFAKWVGAILGDGVLAAELGQIDKVIQGEDLRTALREKIRKRLEELSQPV